ncbi:hypothetical protein AB0J80_37380 [Actinoplanes sp. NPDC049548]|uniref:hypothetical protein n=1 Tax=Actinoplanes sp. NPDC049548 TaxID=3155152 RepID=UPI00342605D1
MRRLVFPVILASGLVMVGPVPALAEPAPGTPAKAPAGKKVCKVTDPLLNELSGIVATDDGYIVINDGSDAQRQKVFYLNKTCDIVNKVPFSGDGPRDTEDMVLSPDGKTLWIADTGDNGVRKRPPENRETIGVWTMPVTGAKEPKLHRLKYPDGDYHDAEALLLDGDGRPIIITKEVTGPAMLYTPTAALKTNNTEGVPLKKVGQLELPRTDTQGSAFARLAQGVVTGAAIAPGGGKVVIRTYLDAFEWDVSNGDVLAALKNKPRGTGLPNEPFGEAITYSADGKTFATVSDFGDIEDEDSVNNILRYTPATKVVEANTDAAKKSAASADGPSWFSELSLSDITYLVGGVGVLGALLVGAGIFGIVRARKKPQPEPADKPTGKTGPKPSDAETELLSVGGPTYGNPGAAASAPGVYGGTKPKGTGVYGGAAGLPGAATPPVRPGGAPQGRPGAAQPARPGAAPVRPGAGAQPGRPGAAPVRPGAGGQPGPAAHPGRPGAAAQPGRPGPAGQPGRPGAAGQGGRPGNAAQPGRSGPAGQPGRPGAAPSGRPRPAGGPQGRAGGGQPQPGGQPGRPAQPGHPGGGQPGRPAGGQQGRAGGGAAPGRPAQGGQPARPAGGQPSRPSGGQQGRPAGDQPGRSGGAPGRPPQGGQPRPGGVYGAPPPPAPPGDGRQASSSHPSGFFGA